MARNPATGASVRVEEDLGARLPRRRRVQGRSSAAPRRSPRCRPRRRRRQRRLRRHEGAAAGTAHGRGASAAAAVKAPAKKAPAAKAPAKKAATAPGSGQKATTRQGPGQEGGHGEPSHGARSRRPRLRPTGRHRSVRPGDAAARLAERSQAQCERRRRGRALDRAGRRRSSWRPHRRDLRVRTAPTAEPLRPGRRAGTPASGTRDRRPGCRSPVRRRRGREPVDRLDGGAGIVDAGLVGQRRRGRHGSRSVLGQRGDGLLAAHPVGREHPSAPKRRAPAHASACRRPILSSGRSRSSPG